MTNHITKSRLLSGLRCPKLLWLQTHQPERARPSSASRLTIANGIEAGRMARRSYPGGILVEHVEDPDLAVADTARLIAMGGTAPMFEAAFLHSGVLVRCDILAPEGDAWRLIEVKSSGSVKGHHLVDCAIQLWVLEGAGIKVGQVCVAHVDTGFEYAGDGDYSRLFIEADVTEAARGLVPEVSGWVASHWSILANPMPGIRMGPQCKPDCQFTAYCELGEPKYPVSILPNARKVLSDLKEAGIEDVRDIPDGLLESHRQIMVWQATRTGEPYVSPDLKTQLAKLPYPRYYLDFETINFVIPRWAGTRPHQQLPFQWSCHVEGEGGALRHLEFFDWSGNAPMRGFAESLIAALAQDGPVIVYGSFESTVIKGLIAMLPDLEGPLTDILDRLVNLLPWLQNHYYHPAMKGSWSIKAVLPTVASHLDYAELQEVQNGTLAQLAYLDIISPDTEPAAREQKIRNLLRYCELDTRAMLEVVRFFQGFC